MSFIDKLDRARAVLERQGRLSTRALGRELEVAGDELEELIEELVDVQRVARREGNVLVWAAAPAPRASDLRSEPAPRAASLGSPEPADARKVVTIVFADLVGSTALHERLDPESARRFMQSYYAAMRGAVEAQGGTVTQLLGDGVKAVFGIPRVAEDDAIRAVRAAVGMQEAFHALADAQRGAVGQTGLRVAVNTGEVVANDRTEIIGDPVNVAARLQEQGKDGDVVVGESTHRLVATLVTLELLGSFALKGRSEQVKAYRVASLDRPAGVATAAFVGRAEELARLTAVYEAAVAKPAAALAVLIGSPGLGKSRLIDEFARARAETATLVRAHCDAAGGTTFAPLAQALRELLGVEDGASAESLRSTLEEVLSPEEPDRARIASGIASLLAGSPASPEETFFVVRRLLAGLAATRSVVLVIDDLHWAEPLLLDLVEHLVQWGSGTPLLILVGARPELRDLRSSLVTPGGFVSEVLLLGGLDAGAAMRLAANVIGATDLPAAVAAKVLATSEGNPLFVGELVRMLVDEGAIERRGERWVVGANLAALEMPPTIHALLAARIERLGPDDRAVLERAAVVGRHFSRRAVAALLGPGGAQLDARLEALRRTELIERDTGWFLGEPVLRFHHVLIRDAAYRRLLKGTRAELHEQLADWIEAQVGDAAEHDETIGWHLEQAHQHRRELGPLDARGHALGERAARRLGTAGRRALARDDAPVAAGLLGRALERLAEGDSTRAELALDWCEALLASGDVTTAERAVAELARFAGDPASAGDPRLAAWHTCFRGQLTVLTAPQALLDTVDTVAAAAGDLARFGDAAGEAKGHFVHALALARLGRIGGCEAALDKALAAARRADDRRRANTVLAIAPLAALWGPSPVTRASGRCLDVVRVLRITQGAPAVEAVALSCQAVLEALRGRADAARRMIAAARKMVEDLGLTQRLLETDAFGGLIDLLEGDAPAAERALRAAYHGLRDLGLGIDAARAAALLARALLAQDRGADAEALSHESEALAGDDLKAAIAWRGVRAEALARRGEHAAAVELAQAAVGIAAATDALLDHADARLALAAALRAAGRGGDADAEERRAIELWEAKGAVLLVERTQRAEAHGAATAAAPQPTAAAPQPGPAPARRRRVTPNRATAALVPFNAALAARDLETFREQLSESYEEIDHPSGASFGRNANVASLERLLRSRDALCLVEPLATLGDALVLSCRTVSASATDGGRFDVGAYGHEAYTVAEVDESGRFRRHEVFGSHHLGDALTSLYERHAALLHDGPERERAAATARTVAAVNSLSVDRLSASVAPLIELVDHQSLHLWSARGADQYLAQWRGQMALAIPRVRVDEVLALEPDALLARRTHSGIAREGGGEFGGQVLELNLFDADGLLARVEVWGIDREAEALARFDELTARAAPQPTTRRRVTPSAATATAERFGAAVAARDLDALADVLCEEIETLHHQTGVKYGRKAFLATWRSLFRAETMLRRQETIASLGDALALAHHTIRLEGFTEEHIADVGAVDIDEVVLFEVDDRGRTRRFDIFPTEKLGDALVRLYERHAELLPDGAEKTRAAATARTVAVWNGPLDIGSVATVTGPLVELVDHRSLHLWSARGAGEYLEQWRGHFALTDTSVRTDGVLALERDAFLVRRTYFGIAREGGGEFVTPVLELWVCGADGRSARVEVWDPDAEAAALARFDELSRANAVELGPFENAASRAWREVNDAWNARDLERFAAPHAPALRYRDDRRLLQLDLDRAGFLDFTRPLLTMSAGLASLDLVATRGERLALMHSTMVMEDDAVGPSTIESLFLIETDDRGSILAYGRWDLDDRDAALAALDARWETNEEARYARPWQDAALAFARRDLEGWAASSVPDVAIHDHRLVGYGVQQGAEAMIRAVRELIVLAPDARSNLYHVRACRRGMISHVAWSGTRDGGAFESPFVTVAEFAPDGLTIRIDFYEPEHVDRARGRYAELRERSGEVAGGGTGAAAEVSENAAARARFADLARGAEAPARFANAVTRFADGFVRVTDARDWTGFADLIAPDLRFDDRRPLLRMELPREGFLEQFRTLFDVPNARWTATPLATRGERLALFRLTLKGDVGDDGGPLEIEHLWVGGVGDDGRCDTIVLFEPVELDAAYAELDARYVAGEGARYPHVTAVVMPERRPFLDRDWDAFAAMHAQDLVCHDHRLLGWGTLHGATAWERTQQVLVELAPDTGASVNHVTISEHGVLRSIFVSGTRDGGAFELAFLRVDEIDAAGRICRIDLFDADEVDAARARFAELAASGAPPSPSLVKPTAATMALERLYPRIDAQDWDAVRAACSEAFTWQDRRPIVGISGDVELMIASARERMASGARHERRETIGTAGDRVAIGRVLWAGGPADGRFEVEFLSVLEIDAEGLLTAMIFLEPDDLRAAQREAWARWAAIDPTAAEITTYAGAVVDAWNAQDPDRLRALLSEDLVAEDHRRTGIGRSEGREAYLRSVVALWDLAPDSRLEAGLVWLAHAPHAGLYLCRREGVLPDGGEFVSEFLALAVVERGFTARLEVFEPDAADAALARFAELCPDPLRIPPNAVTRTWDRWCAAAAVGDWDTITALYNPSYRSEDRRPLIRLTTDLAGMLENDRVLVDAGWRPTRSLLGTAGDRLALQHILWTTGEPGAHSEIEILQLTQVDDEGRFLSSATFDPDDRAAAFRELGERHLALTRPAAIWQQEVRRDAGRDLARLRAAFPDDFFFHDRRRTGLGRIDGADAYLRSVAALHELAPDAIVGQPLHFLADEPHGTLSIAHSFGTLANGGAFESVYAMIMLYGPDGMRGVELFELDDLDAARARFAELGAARTA